MHCPLALWVATYVYLLHCGSWCLFLGPLILDDNGSPSFGKNLLDGAFGISVEKLQR